MRLNCIRVFIYAAKAKRLCTALTRCILRNVRENLFAAALALTLARIIRLRVLFLSSHTVRVCQMLPQYFSFQINQIVNGLEKRAINLPCIYLPI